MVDEFSGSICYAALQGPEHATYYFDLGAFIENAPKPPMGTTWAAEQIWVAE